MEKSNFPYNLCVLNRIHNDHRYLQEWVEYHNILGVDQFYIADDCTSDDKIETDRLLFEYEKKGLVTYSPSQDFNDCQNRNPNEFNLFTFLFRLAQGKCNWIGMWDVDEFVVISDRYSQENNLMDYLKSLPHGVARLPWFYMGSDGHGKADSNQLVIERYTNGSMDAGGCHVKSIVRSDVVIDVVPNSHVFDINSTEEIIQNNNYFCNEGETEIVQQENGDGPCRFPSSPVFIKHYQSKSWEEYMLGRGILQVTSTGSHNPWADNSRGKWENLWINSTCKIAEQFTKSMAMKVRQRIMSASRLKLIAKKTGRGIFAEEGNRCSLLRQQNIILLCGGLVFIFLYLLRNTKRNSKATISVYNSLVQVTLKHRKFLASFSILTVVLVMLNNNVFYTYLNDPKSGNTAKQMEQPTPVIIEINGDHSFEFWTTRAQGGEPRLCKLLRNITGVTTLGLPDEKPFFIRDSDVAPIISFILDCSGSGNRIGNLLYEMYMVRLTVALAQADFAFQCKEGTSHNETQIFPWLAGFHKYSGDPGVEAFWPFDLERPDESALCKGEDFPLHLAAHAIQRDMRRMAILLLGKREGLPNPIVTSGLDLPTVLPAPIYANEDVDDVALHFRCGDELGSAPWFYGVIKFDEYRRQISSKARSIGIHTQPFVKTSPLLRNEDRNQALLCQRVVVALADYLSSSFPEASISLRNTHNDSIPLNWARMVMANQTFVSLTTFAIFPVIGTFGQGYAQRGNPFVNPFVEHLPGILRNIHMMNAPVLSSEDISKMNIDEVINWLLEPRQE